MLAPAGDLECLRVAAAAGADAVYFGLKSFNARARSENFDASSLSEVTAELHERGVRAYVTLNTLVFDHELRALEQSVRACAEAGVDAVIVQDLGVAALVSSMAPQMPIHASTQMTCTDAGSVEFARRAGASRVIVARELSVEELAEIARTAEVELEVFVHGALCIAYSGQCLTSEAIGGRSANRGACAQACRLPYELVVDGEKRDLGEKAYLLSPQDLEASSLVRSLAEVGVASLKIEGRLKGPAYVAATTKLYRAAVDALRPGHGALESDLGALRERALQTYSRGSAEGFLGGVDHQRLVEARGCDHRGLELGSVVGVERSRGKSLVEIDLVRGVKLGDGVLIEGGLGGVGELGGRVWEITRHKESLKTANAGCRVRVWFGPDKLVGELARGRRVWRNDAPVVERELLSEVRSAPRKVGLTVTLSGALGEHPVLSAQSADGRRATVTLDAVVEPAHHRAVTDAELSEKLSRLGDTVYALETLTVELPAEVSFALSAVNRGRRAVVEALDKAARRSWTINESALSVSLPVESPSLAGGLYVLCRNETQMHAAIDAGADGVWLDFLELTGTGHALRAARERWPGFVGVAPPRIRKPREEKIDRYLASLNPDAVLARGLGSLIDPEWSKVTRVGDFSLNVTNGVSARAVLATGLGAFTPAFDLDAVQLTALLSTGLGPWAEVVLHHPMPLFHMEHCVIAALLSSGSDYKTCGRPCEKHKISLRDRAGNDLPVEADVGCRNTVFHSVSQSAAELVEPLKERGVKRWRVELVREDALGVARVVEAYKGLVGGNLGAREVWRTLGANAGYGVVRGSLRVLPTV